MGGDGFEFLFAEGFLLGTGGSDHISHQKDGGPDEEDNGTVMEDIEEAS